ncbi:hypothetical protein FDZ14_29790 (plasmid) [Priestia megaterium]|uniref:Uncharacterized protein n=1 Tax=Priestia megaterium TaxID=1404 RepID=A0A6M6E6R9_PRIMG|nr:hypothetical protein FDZ14_29790 [Priestia megaterium]
MTNSISNCEACKLNAISVVEAVGDYQQPYKVCGDCHQRLVTHSLRPIEWYNLAVIHSHNKYLLSDDFYDDNGVSYEFEDNSTSFLGYESPTLNNAKGNLADLIDFSITKWSLEEEVIVALKAYSPLNILDYVKTNFHNANNIEIKSRMLEIAAEVLGPVATGWIRELWSNYNEELLYPLAEATATSLPTKEGLHNVLTRLNAIDKKELPIAAFSCLYRFGSSDVLDWIEETCKEFNDNWGRLAAVSHPTWDRMKDWLNKGRPLSLIALDTMENCISDFSDPIIEKISPQVLGTDTDDLEQVLTAYYQNDAVPRVKRKVAEILENKDVIFG